MRHTFAHFTIAFLTGALTAPIVKNYVSELLSEDIHTFHSMDNHKDTQTISPPVQGTLELETTHSIASNNSHQPSLLIATDAYIAPSVALYGEPDQRIGLASGTRILQMVTLAVSPETSDHDLHKNPIQIQGASYAIYIGERAILDCGTRVLSPALIEENVYIGPGTIICNACLRTGVIVEEGAMVCNVEIPPYRRVKAWQVVRFQHEAENLTLCRDSLTNRTIPGFL